MPDIAALIQTHGANPWAYLPLTVLLGQAIFKAVIDMVLDHLALGGHERSLNRLQLLGDGDAVAPLLHHGHDSAQVPLGAPQPGEKGGIGCMGHNA